jgi:hypothetical protein
MSTLPFLVLIKIWVGLVNFWSDKVGEPPSVDVLVGGYSDDVVDTFLLSTICN